MTTVCPITFIRFSILSLVNCPPFPPSTSHLRKLIHLRLPDKFDSTLPHPPQSASPVKPTSEIHTSSVHSPCLHCYHASPSQHTPHPDYWSRFLLTLLYHLTHFPSHSEPFHPLTYTTFRPILPTPGLSWLLCPGTKSLPLYGWLLFTGVLSTNATSSERGSPLLACGEIIHAITNPPHTAILYPVPSVQMLSCNLA